MYLELLSLICMSFLYISTFCGTWAANISSQVVIYLLPLFMVNFKTEIYYDYINFYGFLDLCQNEIFFKPQSLSNVNKTFIFQTVCNMKIWKQKYNEMYKSIFKRGNFLNSISSKDELAVLYHICFTHSWSTIKNINIPNDTF